jgi:myo-inositol catabolism protein IolC
VRWIATSLRPPARRRLQPASEINAKLRLCTLGYAGRKIQSGENQNRYLMLFDDRHGFTALQAVQSGSFSYTCNAEYSLRRAEWGGPRPAEFAIRQDGISGRNIVALSLSRIIIWNIYEATVLF